MMEDKLRKLTLKSKKVIDALDKHMYGAYNTKPMKNPKKIQREQLPFGGSNKKLEPNRGLTY